MSNREQRRHGIESQQEREIPVHILAKADGTQEVIGPEAEPCNGCRCCVIWTRDLQMVRDAIMTHSENGHSKNFRDLQTCPVCFIASGGIDSSVTNGN